MRVVFQQLVVVELGRYAMAENVELRVMPSGDGRWYWEVTTPGPTVIARGVADSEPIACKEAGEAARKAKLIA
jgi:hypothetical protein